MIFSATASVKSNRPAGDPVYAAARLHDMTGSPSRGVVLSRDVLKTADAATGNPTHLAGSVLGRIEPLAVPTVAEAGLSSADAADFAVAAAQKKVDSRKV